jgi:hypothetical protein
MEYKRPFAVDLSEKQKSAITQRSDSGQLDARKSLPMRSPRADLDPEFAGAAEHRAHVDPAAPAAIAEPVGFSVHAVKAQEQSQGSKPGICGVGIPVLDRHLLLNSSRLPTAFDVPFLHSQALMVAHPGAGRLGAEANQC